MLVKELIEHLKTLPQDRSIHCQVVGQKTGAWAMEFCFNNITHSDWMVQLKISHPNLLNLPVDGVFGE